MRYSTTGANKWDNAQPVTQTRGGGIVALGHNGNLTNTGELRAEMEVASVDLRASTRLGDHRRDDRRRAGQPAAPPPAP